MPFIDDALLWCPDNDGRMVDISTCLQVCICILLLFLVFKHRFYLFYCYIKQILCSSIIYFCFRLFPNYFSLPYIFEDAGENNQQEVAGSSCDLSALDPLCNDSEEFLRQLAENPFELDSFFTEYTGVDVKVKI